MKAKNEARHRALQFPQSAIMIVGVKGWMLRKPRKTAKFDALAEGLISKDSRATGFELSDQWLGPVEKEHFG